MGWILFAGHITWMIILQWAYFMELWWWILGNRQPGVHRRKSNHNQLLVCLPSYASSFWMVTMIISTFWTEYWRVELHLHRDLQGPLDRRMFVTFWMTTWFFQHTDRDVQQFVWGIGLKHLWMICSRNLVVGKWGNIIATLNNMLKWSLVNMYFHTQVSIDVRIEETGHIQLLIWPTLCNTS